MKKIFHKFIEFIKNNKLLVLAFFSATIVINIGYFMFDIAPYGSHSTLCVDFYHQYGPMMGELYDRIRGFDSLVYSFTMGTGLPFFRNFLNYLSSPFNIIMYLFPRSNLVMSYGFIIQLKAIMACVFMTYYLSKKFNNKNLYMITFGIIYAFSSYFTAYYWNIMWIDGMVFLPLITLGIENIVNLKKWKLYVFTLAVMLAANYYIGYMICLFSVIYFIFYLFYKTHFLVKDIKTELKEALKKCFIFGLSSLAAGALVAFLLIPLFKSTASISATGGSWPISQYYDFTLKDFLLSHLSLAKTVTFASDKVTSPNISCGILGIVGLILFVINPKIKLKAKLTYLIVLGIILFAFFNPGLDYIFQAFHVPNDLPYRYSFLYTFVLVIISCYGITNIRKIKNPIVTTIYILLMIVLILISQYVHWVNLEINNIYINMIILTLFYIFYSCDYYIDMTHNFFYISIVIVSMIDAIVTLNYNWNITQDITQFNSDYNDTVELLNDVKKYDNSNFYRIENTVMMTYNDSSWYGYNGLTTFSSMAYENVAKLQYDLGMPGNEINSYSYIQQTPIYDLLFDIKYFIGNTNDKVRYKNIITKKETANEFMYNVGLGFGTSRNIKSWTYTGMNPFVIQNDFIQKATGVSNVLEESFLINSEEVYNDDNITIIKYRYKNNFDNMYLYASNSAIKFFTIGDVLYYNDSNYNELANGILEYSYADDYHEKKIINISSTADELEIYVAYNYYYDKGIKVYEINQDKFDSAYQVLNKHVLNITEFNESSIYGSISLDDAMMVYTSISYDEGWHAYVDEKEVNTYRVGNALLGFDAPKGTHKIKLIYKIPYFKEGLIISLFTLTIIVINKKITFVYNDILKKLKQKKKKTNKKKKSK